MSNTWAATRLGQQGPSFVWLHGWGQTHESLSRLAGLFEADGQHILLDQPGFGNTPMLPAGSGTKAYADALAEQWQVLGIEGPAVLVCHSFGARVATQLAAHHPKLVRGLIFIGGAGLKRQRSMAFKIRSVWLKTLGKLARLSDRILGTRKLDAYRARYGSADYKAAGPLRDTFVAVVNEDLVDEASRVNAPALLLYGSGDTETPPEIGAKYARLMPRARFETLEGFGHLDILERGAYQVESHMRRFLEELTP